MKKTISFLSFVIPNLFRHPLISAHKGMLTFVSMTATALLFSVKGFSQAPAIQWQISLGGTNIDQAYSVQQTSDGGYVVAGYSVSNDGDVTGNHGLRDYWIVKLNGSGNIQWQKSLGGTSVDQAYSVKQTSDGGYAVAGYSLSNDGDVTGNHGSSDYWLVKLDGSGNIQWQKCLGGTNDDSEPTVQQTSDGGYVVAGFSFSNNGNVTGNHGNGDYWLVKLDGNGIIQWQKCLGGTNVDQSYSVQQTSDSGYVVAGYSDSNDGDVTGNHSGYDYWLVKLDGSGNLQWQKSLGGTGSDLASSVQQTSDGGYVVAGSANSNNGDVTGNHGFYDYWVVKLDSNGNLQWQKSLGGTGNEGANSIQQASDGGYIVAGQSQSNDGDVTGNHGGNDYWVVKLDGSGNLQWQKSLGGTSYDVALSVQQTSDGGYVIAGWSQSNNGDVTGNHGNWDYWVVKLSQSTGTEEEINSATSTLFPNPFHETATLTINTTKIEEGTIEIKNILGATAQPPKHFTGNKIKLQRNNLPAGIYFYRITTKDNVSVNGKFIID